MQRKTTKRAYDASRRRVSAEKRRERILETARELFGRYGYGATSIERIAGEAGVAVPTFYAMYRSKRALLFALLDLVDRQADVAGLQRDLRAAAGDVRNQLRRLVSFTCRFYAQAGDVIDIARGAGSTNEDLLDLWREGEERRLRGQKPLVNEWVRAGAIRNGVSVKEATDILWAMTGADHYRLFIVERNWSADRYEAWLEKTLERLLLR
ncbi:MAG TPA: helix-turn-helix domain-containing protein [Candidatus Angelobacter sp.]|nr:helix-turn-helix domain-containing protein [Candidatus Angelobacter sp.]